MEAPFDVDTWDGVTGAIYTGAGSAEWIWVLISIALVILALIFGWRHEKHAYTESEK